jgi:hypothetical protein
MGKPSEGADFAGLSLHGDHNQPYLTGNSAYGSSRAATSRSLSPARQRLVRSAHREFFTRQPPPRARLPLSEKAAVFDVMRRRLLRARTSSLGRSA